MKHYGLKVEKPGPIPDHIAVLFNFMAEVIEGSFKAYEKGDVESAAQAESIQLRFFREYIHPWVRRFLNCLERAEPAPF